MLDLELYQIFAWLGRFYQIALMLYGIYLLVRIRLWLLFGVFLMGASAYIAYSFLAAIGATPPVTPYRLLSVYGNAICFHILLLVIQTLTKRQSLGRLRPFGHG